jgi:hypothetical protein
VLWLLATLLVAAPADAILDRLRADLPKGWSMSVTDAELALARDGKVHALFQNMINAPGSDESDREREKRIVAYGREVDCKLVYRLEPRWSAEKLEKARDANAAVYREIASLPKRFKIDSLKNEHLSAKREEFFVPKTEDDTQRIADYQAEKAKLEAGVIKLPGCNTERFSLFEKDRTGVSDEFTLVAPEVASREAFQLENRLRELCRSR